MSDLSSAERHASLRSAKVKRLEEGLPPSLFELRRDRHRPTFKVQQIFRSSVIPNSGSLFVGRRLMQRGSP
jgi:hypothetical protein